MALTPNKNYSQTRSKLRTLWEIADKLIASYEDFDRRLIDLEIKVDSISSRVDSTITGINRNV